ncbi:MAG: hypothetical protein J5895_00370 [Alphaproteobacteria bacterium]|nr:hypothetical protein [Alphaproteobacteria bacterium]
MEKFIKTIQKECALKKQQPLEAAKLIVAQKALAKEGYPLLPADFIDFLKICNGVKGEDSAVLGIEPEDMLLDIVSFNKAHNAANCKVILGYDDFCFLVFDASKQCYLLLDREDGEELDDFSKDSLAYALSAILHF